MDVLSILTYAALTFFAFKVFKIPVNKWTVTTAVIGGVFLIGTIFLTMAYFHPYTPEGRIYFQTTPIIPQVRGIVIDVPVRDNRPLKKGDILFKIDPAPFQSAYDHAKAALQEAQKKLHQLQEQVESSKALVDKSAASLHLAEVTEKRMKELLQKRTIAQQRYDQVYAKWQEALQQNLQDQANLKQAQSGVATQQSVIDEAQSRLDKAKFNLDSTEVRAPSDGYCIQVRLRPGMMAVPLPLKPSMTFISKDDFYLVGLFEQNPLQNIKVGNKAEVIFPAIPGRAFRGKITKIMAALGEGQLEPNANMMQFANAGHDGRVPVFIELEDSIADFQLPPGCAARVATYSEQIEFLAPIRQILLRMMSWKNIVCFEAI